MTWFTAQYTTSRTNPLLIDFRIKEDIFINSAIDNAISAVNDIVNKYPPPYTLLVSGGIDSQAMMYAWKLSLHEFNVVHYNYGNDYNKDDTNSLVEFCNIHRIPYKVNYFDAEQFITSELLTDYALRYDCSSPQILSYIKFCENHKNETIIMAGNYITSSTCGINYTLCGLDRFSKTTHNNFVPFFFLYTPQLAYSFYMYDDELKTKTYTNTDGFDWYDIRVNTYKHHGFPVIRQKQKLTGFEIIKEKFDSLYVSAIDRLRYNKYPSKRPFDILYRYKLYEKIGKYTELVDVIHHDSVKDNLHNKP
jgi:hypothetical protein